VSFAHEREQVMFAHAVEGDIANENKFVVLFFEDLLEVSSGFDVQSAEDFGVHARDAFGCFAEPIAVGVFADGKENFADGALNAELVHIAAFGRQCAAGENGLEIGHRGVAPWENGNSEQ
jgi:hypothetical protein